MLAVAGLVASFAGAQEWTPRRSFRIFSKANSRGLPQSSVMALAQDRDGLLWIGTLDGAATFDGRSILPVPAVSGAPLRGVIAAIVARKDGGVSVGSAAGVHLWDGRRWKLVASTRGVAALAESVDGKLWMADLSGDLWTLGAGDRWTRHPEMNGPALALAPAPDGSVWAATESGAQRLFEGRAEPVTGAPLPGRPGAILAARDGRVWIATVNGTVQWTSGTPGDAWHAVAFERWPRAAFRCLAQDRRGRIWAGSFGGGLVYGTADSPFTVWDSENGPFEAGVMSILGDREGSVWFGLNAVGLAQWTGEAWSHRTEPGEGISNRQLFSAFGLARGVAPRSLLVAAYQQGVIRLGEGPARHYGAAEGLTEDVRSVVEPEADTLWAGTRFGLFESKGGQRFRQTFRLASGFVMGIFRSPRGRWYAATSTAGVLLREGNAWVPAAAINAALDDLHVRSMTWRGNGELWISTLRGISIFRPDSPPARLTSQVEPAIPDSVNAVLERPGDEVWAAGTGGIAVRTRGAWRRMTEADGVPGQTVYSLAAGPGGAVWAGGSAGVGRYMDGRWTVWDSRSGLLQEECNLNGLIVDEDGSVFVSTMGGLAKFDPSLAPLPAPPLSIAWRDSPPRSADGTVRLPSSERALRLRWTAAWLGPRPVQFRVRLPRLREGWSPPTSDDHLDIENLGAGRWDVEVEGRVEGQNEWTAPLRMSVLVAPRWHETAAGRGALAALLAAVILGGVRFRVRALRRHAAALEATISERTAELAEKVELLQESEQRALGASRAKSAFLANMSHELRTPLNGVLGFAQILSRRKDRDPEDREGLAVIVKSGEHLLGLINDVLSLSKIEAGRVSLASAPFDLPRLLGDVEVLLRPRAEAKNLRLACQIDPGVPRGVIGDEGRLRQILLNLLGNAVKFTERGEIAMRASWREGRGTFAIEDTGPGIAPEERPRLFEPFTQTETGRRAKEGTGLGLALSRDLARLMGGDITVESEPGRGTRFQVEVGLPESPADVLPGDREERRVAAVAPGQKTFRILVVDDLALNRTVLSRLLSSAGFDVREASGGAEAFALWKEWNPDLVWMDKRMPGVDGLEATRRIREAEKVRGGRTAIIALSASALEHERGEILAAGCDDFVAKPFREETIFARIAEHVGVRYVYESDPSGEPPAPPDRDSSSPAPSRRVLLVDDDPICRDVAREVLRIAGVGVTTASSGAEALRILRDATFDLVLMDVHMADMDGVETARRIKTTIDRRLPVIAMTAETFESRRELAETGMDDYVAKPVEASMLAEVLGRWLPPERPSAARPA